MLKRGTRGIGVHLASLLAARTLLGARGLTARNQKLLVTRASLLDSKLINTVYDGQISCVVLKILRNRHFASTKLSFYRNLHGIHNDSNDEVSLTPFPMELRT